MKYFESINGVKVVKSELPSNISCVMDTDKDDWKQIYFELGFIVLEEHLYYSPALGFKIDFIHTKDKDLKVRHIKEDETHIISPVRASDPQPKDYRNNMIPVIGPDTTTLALRKLLQGIRCLYPTK